MATELPTPEEIVELRRLHEQTTTWYFGRAAGHAFVADDVSADSEARIASVGSYADAMLIAAMRNHLPSLLDAAERARELDALFDLQHKRSGEAIKAWRDAHPGNDLISPDLGALLTWLLEERR